MNTSAISQFAGASMPQHDHYLERIQNLNKRIEANLASGRITEEEAKGFSDSLQGIVDNLNSTRTANGGYLTPQDRLQANKDMNSLLRQIHSAANADA